MLLSPGSALHQTAMAACEEYRIDMTAAVFGTCKCGQPKLAHSAEALAPKKKRGAAAAAAATKPSDPDEPPPPPAHMLRSSKAAAPKPAAAPETVPAPASIASALP